MITRKLRLGLLSSILLFPPGLALSAQKPSHSAKNLPPSAYKLVAIKVTGTKRYKQEDVARASGLAIGQTVHDDDLKDVVRALGESGAFTDISYSFEYSPEGTKLELKLRDAEKFVPVHFDNVVWFNGRDLAEKLHASIPLFDGELPATGQMVSQLSDALQALLVQKNVAGEVDYIREPDDGPVESFTFSVSGPHITIRNVAFSGADAAELPLLTVAGEGLQGTEFALPKLKTLADKNFLPIYQARGYLKAQIGDAEPEVASTEDHDVSVDVTFPVHPGPRFVVSALEITGNKLFTGDALRTMIQQKLGEAANAIQLEKDLAVIRHMYGTRGYMAAGVRPESKPGDQPSTIQYIVHITEGDLYHMGDLDIRGLDSKATSHLQNEWTLRAGDIYDSGYAGRFLQQVYKEMGDWNTNVHETLNDTDKTVDVTIRFDSRS